MMVRKYKTEAESEFEPRHRILGAIILVTLGFIVFSVVLNERPRRLSPEEKQSRLEPNTRVVVTDVPLPRTRSMETRPVAAVTRPSEPSGPQHRIAGATVTKPKQVAISIPSANKPESDPKHKPLTRKQKSEPAVIKASGKQWMIQVGTFADSGNAKRLSKMLMAQHYRVVLKPVSIKEGRAIRVRVGPYADKASAKMARDRIQQKMGIEGVVLAKQ